MIEQNPKNNQRTAAVNKWIEKDESAHLFQLYNKQFPQNRFYFSFIIIFFLHLSIGR